MQLSFDKKNLNRNDFNNLMWREDSKYKQRLNSLEEKYQIVARKIHTKDEIV